MRISKAFEHGVCVLLILGSQRGHTPLTSDTLSTLLRVSDSSLKKTLRRLTVAGLIVSTPGKDGGYTLARPLSTMSLADVFAACEGEPTVKTPSSALAERIFPDARHVRQVETLIGQTIDDASQAFTRRLAKVSLDRMLKTEAVHEGSVDWEDKAATTAVSRADTTDDDVQ
ncbi:Rrf2 family transcriptional regulator [Bifidobacterium thermophilum]|uniref:RrF2 family transcriptional regulator n=1 Tax=Bifidobacterium thermophilum TaxID=33905 RepID=UPI0030AF573C